MITFSIIVPSLLLVSILHLEDIARDISIFVVIPPFYHGPFEYTPFLNYIYSNKSGQVNQRMYAASCSDSKYIILLDDDIIITKQFLDSILDTYMSLSSIYEYPVLGVPIVSSNSSSAFTCSYPGFIIPVLSIIESTPHDKFLKPSSLSNLFYSTPHLCPSGQSIQDSPSYHRADYISGGFSIIPLSIFPLFNYYPFRGKAYSEDILLSLYLRKAGGNLFVSESHSLLTNPIAPSFTFQNLKAKLYILKFSSLSFKYPRYFLSLLVRSFSFYFLRK